MLFPFRPGVNVNNIRKNLKNVLNGALKTVSVTFRIVNVPFTVTLWTALSAEQLLYLVAKHNNVQTNKD